MPRRLGVVPISPLPCTSLCGDFILQSLSWLRSLFLLSLFASGNCLGPDSQFENSVRYLFEKQLAEAELVVLTKTELLSPEDLDSLIAQLQHVTGKIPIRLMSARTGAGVDEWVERTFEDALRQRSSAGSRLQDLWGRRGLTGMAQCHGGPGCRSGIRASRRSGKQSSQRFRNNAGPRKAPSRI